MLLIITPLAMAAAMRPQAWVMFAGVAFVLIVVRYRLSPPGARIRLSVFLAAGIAPPAAIAAVGLARDAVLSGWWLYPVNRFPLPVEWRAPDPSELLTLTLGIARDPGPGYQQAAQGFDWLLPWALRLPQGWEFWLFSGLTALGTVLIVSALIRGQTNLARLLLAAAPGLLASLVWLLLTPPSFRFGWGPLFSTAALIFGWGWLSNRWADRWIAGVGGAVVVAAALVTGASRMPTWPTAVPEISINQVQITENLLVVSPAQGDQCWGNFPLCTPTPAEGLRLRDTDWPSGFDWGMDSG